MHCKFCGYKTSDVSDQLRCPQCGAGSGKRMRIRNAGEMIGKYRILRMLGRGGSGVVYLCDDPVLMTRCAVKVLNDSRAEQDKNFVDRLLREAKIAAALQMPDVVAVLDAGTDELSGEPFVVMEYVDGESLEDVLRDGPLPESAVLGIAIRISAVLASAAALGIVHRDIKPGNILLTSEGNIKLADLGIAKSGTVTTDTISDENTLLGTPNYAAPEQLRSSHTVDFRADIYSLGATMYHMLTGKRPFSADTVFNTIANVLETEAKPISSYDVQVSSATAALVKKMMAKDPDDRHKSIPELLDALRRCSEKRRFSWKNPLQYIPLYSRHRLRLKMHRSRRNRFSVITPQIIIRDLFLCSAVLICLLFLWFNFGRTYSQEMQKESLARYELLRKQEVSELLKASEPALTAEYLRRPETTYRSRREIFTSLLRNRKRHELLRHLISLDLFTDRQNEDFLGIACSVKNCDNDIVEELIHAGADLDYRDRRGRTALMKSLISGNIQAAAMLLNYGADPHLIDNEGRNIWFYLPEKFDEELISDLISTDVAVNVRDRAGRTPVMVFVDRFDSPEMVKILIRNKFNINRKSNSGETALTTAIRRRHMASAEALFNGNANFDESAVKLVSNEYRLKNMMRQKLNKRK